MGSAADVTNSPEMTEAQNQAKKDVGDREEAAPAYVPATAEEQNSVLTGEDGELIDYKTLTWWYV